MLAISSTRQRTKGGAVEVDGTDLGISNPAGVSRVGGFAIFNDQLTFTSPMQANGSPGRVVYTFTVDGALTIQPPVIHTTSLN